MRAAGLVALLLLLTGCWLRQVDTGSAAGGMRVLAPGEYGMNMAAVQHVTGRHGERELSLQFAVSVTPARLELVGLSLVGQRVFTLSHDGVALSAEAVRELPEGFDPVHVLLDFQLAFGPVRALEAALGAGQRLALIPQGRQLLAGDEVVSEVRFEGARPWDGPVAVVNFRHGYELRIRTLQWQELGWMGSDSVGVVSLQCDAGFRPAGRVTFFGRPKDVTKKNRRACPLTAPPPLARFPALLGKPGLASRGFLPLALVASSMTRPCGLIPVFLRCSAACRGISSRALASRIALQDLLSLCESQKKQQALV